MNCTGVPNEVATDESSLGGCGLCVCAKTILNDPLPNDKNTGKIQNMLGAELESDPVSPLLGLPSIHVTDVLYIK